MTNGIIETIAAGTGYFNSYINVVPLREGKSKAKLEGIAEESKKVSPVSKIYNPNGRAIDYHEAGQNVNFFA